MDLNGLTIAGLSPVMVAFSLVVVFPAAIVRGYSGFGFSALLVAGLSLFVAPAEVVPVALLLEIAASLHMLPKVWKDVDRRLVGWLFLGAATATPLGSHLLATLPASPMRITLYVVCLVAALAIRGGLRARNGHGVGPIVGAGLVGGAVNGATAMGGLMVVIFLLTGSMAAAAMRASLIAFFLVLDMYATALMGAESLLTGDVLLRTAIFTLPLLAGNMLGHSTFVAMAPESFRRYTLTLLVILSGGGLLRTFWGP